MSRLRQKPLRKRGALTIVMGMLVASAVFRIGAGAGHAIANESAKSTQQQPMQAAPDQSVDVLLAKLLEREKMVAEREKEQEMRQVTIERITQEAQKNLAELAEAEQRLKDTLALAGTAAETDLEKLTKTYETMKPKSAAALFEQMDPAFAAGFLGRMKPASAAAILAGLSPERAYTISLTLSGRNLGAPTD